MSNVTLSPASATRTIRTLLVWMVFIAPLLLFLAATYFAPLLGVLAWSVTVPELGVENYTAIVSDSSVIAILWRTFRICTITALVATSIAYVLAYQWVYGPRMRRRFIELAVLVPFWISVLIRAFGWLVLLRPNGLVNEALTSLGLLQQPLQLVRNELGVIIGMTQYMVPFAFFPLVAVMRQIDQRILHAARGMGAGAIRRFVEIFFPLSLPGVVGAYFIVFVFGLGFFVTPTILGGGRVVMAAEYIYTQMSQTTNWGPGAALATVMLLFVGVLVWIISRFIELSRLRG